MPGAKLKVAPVTFTELLVACGGTIKVTIPTCAVPIVIGSVYGIVVGVTFAGSVTLSVALVAVTFVNCAVIVP